MLVVARPVGKASSDLRPWHPFSLSQHPRRAGRGEGKGSIYLQAPRREDGQLVLKRPPMVFKGGFFCFVLFCLIFLPFLGPPLRHMEVPRLRVESEL